MNHPTHLSAVPTPKEAPDMSEINDPTRSDNLVRSLLECECEGIHHDKGCFFYDEWLDADIDTTPLSAGFEKFERWERCKHNMSPFILPSGSVLYASAWRDVPIRRTPPDVGVYLDPCWHPASSFAYAIGWTDFGLPTISDADVHRTGVAVLSHLDYGEIVEVGCIGSHGRTGTFLALLVMMDSAATSSMFGAKRAIDYVRTNHCHDAIETKSQERWISRMSGKMRRGDI